MMIVSLALYAAALCTVLYGCSICVASYSCGSLPALWRMWCIQSGLSFVVDYDTTTRRGEQMSQKGRDGCCCIDVGKR